MPVDEGRIIETWEVDGACYVLRTARWSDLDAYGAMHRALFQEGVMAAPRNADTRTAGEMLGRRLTDMATATGMLLLVEWQDQVVAEGTLQRSNGDGSITLGLLVLKEHRDKGIGRRLMTALEAEAARLGKRRIDLTVWSANPRACHLYTSMGYREVARLPDWVRSDLAPEGVSDLLWMIKDLE